MQLNTGEVHIWSGSIDITADEADELSVLLNQEELARANRLIDGIDQLQFIAAHAMLRQVLALYLDCEPKAINFAYTSYKKPYLPESEALHFNLTHSGKHAALAITRAGSIGIDIEQLTDNNKINVAERYFSPEEISQLHQLGPKEQIAGFYHLWACKEAVIKANGKGLSIPLSSFSVSLSNEPFMLKLEDASWTIIPIDLLAGYKSALAVNSSVQSLTLCEYNRQNHIIRKTIDL